MYVQMYMNSHMWNQRLTCVIEHSPHYTLRQGVSVELVAQQFGNSV